MHIYKILFAAVAVCCCLAPLRSGAEEVQEDQFDGFFFQGYDDDGLFVTVPADIGNGVGLVVGAIPSALTAGAFHMFYAPDYQVVEAGGVAMRCFTYPLGFLVGLPFKILKVAFWDAPVALFGGPGEPPGAIAPAAPASQPVEPEKTSR